MILCITEKPSVGKDIADILGAKTRHEGYFEGNGWCWYGNKSGIGFDPMHYEIRVNNDCGTIRSEKVSCE